MGTVYDNRTVEEVQEKQKVMETVIIVVAYGIGIYLFWRFCWVMIRKILDNHKKGK